MIILISLRKTSLSSETYPATVFAVFGSGIIWLHMYPTMIPATMAMKIHVVSFCDRMNIPSCFRVDCTRACFFLRRAHRDPPAGVEIIRGRRRGCACWHLGRDEPKPTPNVGLVARGFQQIRC